MSTQNVFNRPGVSDEFLTAAGCGHVDENECARRYGFKAAGIAIPFRTMRGEPILDGEKPFARVRLYDATDNQKYHQRPDSGVHIYVPPGFAETVKGSTLILVEGEFKAAALSEAGRAALGLCGLTGAARTITQENERSHVLNDELAALIQAHRPATIVFLGDADVVFNSQFSAEAAKLRKLLRGSKHFSFVEKALVVKCPSGGPKGVDDCRGEQSENFPVWFDALVSAGLDVPHKATTGEIFCDLLSREAEAVKKALAESGHESRRSRCKLLESAARIWNEPAVKLDLSPLLQGIFGIGKTALAGLVKDAAPEAENCGSTTGKKEATVELKPWDNPVNGAELLKGLQQTFNRFLVLPLHAAVLFAVWSLHSYFFDIFRFTPYLHITSPEKECGKSTLAELMNHLCNLATTPGGMTAAAMFRRIERIRPTLLLDEWDTLSDDTRQAALNVLNTGFKWNGVYTICVGDAHDDRDFHTFCPKAIFGLSAAKLPDTTRSRCFTIMLQKKTDDERVEKLTRKFDALILRRKCLRWANDHREELSRREPAMPHGLSARQEDISEPLLAIADACDGIWPDAVRQAILHFCGQAKTDEGDAKHELLKDIQEGFRKQDPPDRFSSAAMRDYLNGLDDHQWGGWNDGKGISQRQIADRLRSYGIMSRNVRLADGKVARGYYLAVCAEAFTRYLPEIGSQSATSATDPVNIEQNLLFQSATDENRSGRENHKPPNEINGCSAVADLKSESAPAGQKRTVGSRFAMTTPHDLFFEAARRGLRLEPAGDKLAVIPKGKCPPDFRATLLANKPALLDWLSRLPCPGYGAIPPADLPLVNLRPRPSIRSRELVIHYELRQTGNQPGPLAAWLGRREARYFDGPGQTWDCGDLAYAAARDAACWQLTRIEAEVWQLLAGIDETARIN